MVGQLYANSVVQWIGRFFHDNMFGKYTTGYLYQIFIKYENERNVVLFAINISYDIFLAIFVGHIKELRKSIFKDFYFIETPSGWMLTDNKDAIMSSLEFIEDELALKKAKIDRLSKRLSKFIMEINKEV